MSAPVAVVAGAGGGGTATALSLAGEGYRVVLLDARSESAESAAAQVRAAGDEADAYGIDLLDADAVAALIAD